MFYHWTDIDAMRTRPNHARVQCPGVLARGGLVRYELDMGMRPRCGLEGFEYLDVAVDCGQVPRFLDRAHQHIQSQRGSTLLGYHLRRKRRQTALADHTQNHSIGQVIPYDLAVDLVLQVALVTAIAKYSFEDLDVRVLRAG